MIIQYGVNRTSKVGRKKVVEHKNGKLIVSGFPEDVGWSQKVRSLIQSKESGWSVTGWAEIHEELSPALVAACEFGFRCAEKGLNLEMTLAEFKKLFSSKEPIKHHPACQCSDCD